MRKLLLYAALLLLTQCASCKDDDPSPLEQLPPATQTGANTFGCLVNGQAYLPKGSNGTSNFVVLYDPDYRGGSLDILTYSRDERSHLTISLGGNNISRVGNYNLSTASNSMAQYENRNNTTCRIFWSQEPDVYCRGQLFITKLDMTTGIISGTFEFTLAKAGCDTIKVTQGRFDKRI